MPIRPQLTWMERRQAKKKNEYKIQNNKIRVDTANARQEKLVVKNYWHLCGLRTIQNNNKVWA